MYDVDNETDFALDMVARLTCNRGFSLNGNDTRACMDDDQADTIGVWSGEMPSCQGGQCVHVTVHMYYRSSTMQICSPPYTFSLK